jgi:molybdopterin converting factor small subunit
MATHVIPPPYRGPTHGAERVEVGGRTVRACIEAVEARHPGFGPMILDANGNVHRFVKLFRNGDQLQGDVLGTALADGDELEVIAAIAGG